MKKEFFQELMNMMMFKKLTVAFPPLRKDKLSENDLEDIERHFKKEGIVFILKKTGQDPVEIKEMALTAFDYSMKLIRERLSNTLDQTIERIQKKSL